MKKKSKLLIINEFFYPAVKGGGPIQSLGNLVNQICDEFEIFVVTSDRDLMDIKPFKNLGSNEWIAREKYKIYYIRKESLNKKRINSFVENIKPDIIYLNSLFNYKFSIMFYLNKKIANRNIKIIIAPRGELYPGALKRKKNRKKLFLIMMRSLRIFTKITWHFTANQEFEFALPNLGNRIDYFISENMTNVKYYAIKYKKIIKNPNELNIAFISRIHPKKNLKYLCNILKQIDLKINLSVYGLLEDEIYWNQCLSILEKSKTKVEYYGVIENDLVLEKFRNNHLFVFPTLGENYGHVIFESLIAGVPVILSDRTPWLELEKKNAGFIISLDNSKRYERKIIEFYEMNQIKYDAFSKSSFEYAKSKLTSTSDRDKLISKFIE